MMIQITVAVQKLITEMTGKAAYTVRGTRVKENERARKNSTVAEPCAIWGILTHG